MFIYLMVSSDNLYTLETQSTVMGKLQVFSEELLKRHGIDPTADTYYLCLPSYELIIGKVKEQILVKIRDNVLAFDYNEGHWFPVSFESKLGKTNCSFIKDDNRMIIPYNLKRFMLFQGFFSKNIRGLLENGVKVE